MFFVFCLFCVCVCVCVCGFFSFFFPRGVTANWLLGSGVMVSSYVEVDLQQLW